MKRLLFLLTLASAFIGCSETNVAGGPGSITTNGRANVDGAPAPFASVSLRALDHMALATQAENDVVVADTYTDDQGDFKLKIPKDGSFRLTISYNGHAFTKVVDASSKETLESVDLVPTAVMQGELDVPKGSETVWVGVYGTDIIVPADENGVFVIPALPANDSLQLYFVNESLEDVLESKSAFFSPTEFVYENYKEMPEIPADTTKPEDKDTVETPVDTVKKVVVLQEDGSVAAYAAVALRESDYKAEKFVLQNSLVKADLRTDAEGKFTMEWPSSGRYRLTVLAGNNSFSKIYDADSLSVIDTLKLSVSSSVASKVTLNSEETYAWVGAYGFDILVKTNSLGAYVLPAVPAGETLDLYFVHADSSEPFVEWSVKSPKEGAACLNPSRLLFDFEENSPLWYMDVDTLYKGSTFKFVNGKVDAKHLLADHLMADESRESKVFSTKYELAKDPYAWALLGSKLEELKNFTAIDSIEFFAKGNGNVRVALENWESYSKNAKAASEWMKVDSVWTRMVVKPSNLCVNSSEKWACDEAWDGVKTQVRQLHFFFAAGSEISIDDVKIHGALF
ncbi:MULTISPECIES: hypothetical protein [unclassified Fibrobacter]|uniref:hypothetical protein n=1 Tax=unclassified Fibrobacter TaxID=2634177 RepID=UPI000D6C6DEF|nr:MULTISPECIES: hypothetical protein [unclassified Fibrobacter]PWJ68970.1 hypothetical protein BGX12_10625 [Fibrobacter sp. UWR4]PZW70816.1 hypothetical protein C8E88_10108 [Fibrobacter sp. UWR1]